MSKNTNVKMVEVIALHDLSYLDHNKEPQYKRQSSRPFPLDEANANQFLAHNAVKLAQAEPAVETEAEANPVDAVVTDDFVDDFAEGAEKAGEPAAAEAVVNEPKRGILGRKGR